MWRVNAGLLGCLLALAAPVRAEDEEAPENEYKRLSVRAMASLKPLLEVRTGEYRKMGKPGPEPELANGKILTRGVPILEETALRIEQVIEVGGERRECLWLITYIPFPEEEKDEQVAGTFSAATFDSHGVAYRLEAEWDADQTVLKWTGMPDSGEDGLAVEVEPVRAQKWEFRDGGELVVTIESRDGKGPLALEADYRTRKAGKEVRFPTLPADRGLGILAELEPILGQWESAWSLENTVDGKFQEHAGASIVRTRPILGGHFIEEWQEPVEKDTEAGEELIIIGAAEEEGDAKGNLRLWIHPNSPPLPGSWDPKMRELTIDHVSEPAEDWKIVQKVSLKIRSDTMRTLDSYFFITGGGDEFGQEIRFSSELERLPGKKKGN